MFPVARNMRYSKWMEELDQMDTPAVEEWRYRDYWYMLELCGAFMNWKPKVWVLNLFYVLMVLTNQTFFLVSYIITVFKVDDIAMAGQVLNYAAVIIICVVTIVFFNIDRKSMVELFATCNSGFYDYKDDKVLPDHIQNLQNRFKLYKKLVKLGVPGYLALSSALVLFADKIDLSFDYETVNATYVNGVYYKLPVKLWTFFTIETDLDWFLLLSYMAMGTAIIALLITSAVFIMVFFGLELILQQNILHNACLEMDERADALYVKLHGRLPSAQPLRKTRDRGLMECYECCLMQVVKHHRAILRYSEKYKTLINWPGGAVVIGGSLSIAMSAITLMKGAGKPSTLMSGLTLLAAEIFFVFVVCEIGQTIKNLSEDIFDAMYSFQWMDCNKQLNKEFIIMKQMLNRPIVLMAGSLTPLDRDTFSSMMSSAYSYMNLLRASKGDE